MADQSDVPAWVAWIAAVGTFIGGLLTAVFKGRKAPANAENYGVKIAELAKRMDARDLADEQFRKEVKHYLQRLFEKADEQARDAANAAKDAAVCRAILDERKKQV